MPPLAVAFVTPYSASRQMALTLANTHRFDEETSAHLRRDGAVHPLPKYQVKEVDGVFPGYFPPGIVPAVSHSLRRVPSLLHARGCRQRRTLASFVRQSTRSTAPCFLRCVPPFLSLNKSSRTAATLLCPRALFDAHRQADMRRRALIAQFVAGRSHARTLSAHDVHDTDAYGIRCAVPS
jgi:hypothetical protein